MLGNAFCWERTLPYRGVPPLHPYLPYQAAHEGRARLLGGWNPLFFWLGSSPPPLSSLSPHAVLWGRMLLRGSPRGVCVIMGAPPSLHAVR